MDAAFSSGTIGSASAVDLQRWSAMLSSTHKNINRNFGDDASRIIRSLAISHVQMANVIRRIDESNRSLQRWVIALAIGALLAAGVQAGVALAFYFGHPSVSKSYNEDAPRKAIQDNGRKEEASGGVNPSPSKPNPLKE